jgi:UDPglucose--hexose-1-phosphate uridylyltransferase
MRFEDSPLNATPHRRYNPLTREWVLVSPHRNQRPWLGQVEQSPPHAQAAYDPACYLCPGNARAGGARNPEYRTTFIFENDYAALLPDAPQISADHEGLVVAHSERGICRVLCFHPRHDLTLASMELAHLRRVVDAWVEQFAEMGQLDFVRYVQIFENRGTMMGASNPHPHCQIWATATIPSEPAKEQLALAAYREHHGQCLLCRYAELESQWGERTVAENEAFLVVVPFWAVWPFETLVIARRHLSGMNEMEGAERDGLAAILKQITSTYDRLFNAPFPYSMGFHQRPTDGASHPEWHLHAHFYPPLLRSATVRKFMVGFEMLGMPQRDITPEDAAAKLREPRTRAQG